MKNSTYPTFQQIVDYTRATKSGAGWKGHCPSHNDKNPSLSIGVGEKGNPLVHCHVCKSEDPWKALVEALSVESPRKIPVKESIFEYEDERENILTVKATRIDYSDGTKSFFQSHLRENKWINGRGGRKVKPYHCYESRLGTIASLWT
jgi:DNA primase